MQLGAGWKQGSIGSLTGCHCLYLTDCLRDADADICDTGNLILHLFSLSVVHLSNVLVTICKSLTYILRVSLAFICFQRTSTSTFLLHSRYQSLKKR